MGRACLLATLVSGCTWVSLEPEAQAIGVLRTTEEAAGCEDRGKIGVKTLARVLGIPRGETKVAVELERLARNDAVGLGANRIAPLGPREGGRAALRRVSLRGIAGRPWGAAAHA